jgi:ankyrin repeat protein
MLAAQNGHLPVVKLLTISGADRTIESSYYPYGTALKLANRNKHQKVAEYLQSMDSVTPQTATKTAALNPALENNKLEDLIKIQTLLKEQAKGKSKDGFTALHWACSNGNVEMVKFLILPETVNEKDKNGYTPLHFAVQSGKLDIVKYLLQNGANQKAKDSKGKTPLDFATEKLKATLTKTFKTTKVSPPVKISPKNDNPQLEKIKAKETDDSEEEDDE